MSFNLGPLHRWPVSAAAAGAIAISILVADSLTHFEIAIAAVYVVVVLLTIGFLDPRGVWMVAGGCMVLAVLSHLLTGHGDFSLTAFINLIISLAVIVVATYLSLRTKAANAALRDSAALVDLTHDTMFVRDMNDVITFWNRAAEALYGWSRDEATGSVTHELLRTVFPTPLKDIMQTISRTGYWEGELFHSKRDGTTATVASRWSMQRDGGGRPIAILETNNDITEQKRAEAALEAAQAELAHATRTTILGELAASIAHEVNQPLAAIVTNGEVSLRWLDREEPDLAEVREAVDAMISNGRRASEIILRLRALTKKAPPEKCTVGRQRHDQRGHPADAARDA